MTTNEILFQVETAEEMLDECAYRLEGLEEKLKEALKQVHQSYNQHRV
jgi:hypothetical protein